MLVTTGKFVCWVFSNQCNRIVCSNLLDSKEKKIFQRFHSKDGWYLYQHCSLSAASAQTLPTSFQKSAATGLFLLPWLLLLLLALANERVTVQLYKERIPCAVQDLRPALSIFSAFSFFSASVIRIIRTKTLWTLLLLSVKLTRERQIYNTLARQRIKKKLQIIAQFQGYVLQDLILPETSREL